jgi:hypothetical protein
MEEALAAFHESHDTVASPNPLFMAVRVLAAMGRNAEAYVLARQVIVEAEVATRIAPKYGKTANAARDKLTELGKSIALLEISVIAPQGGTLTVNGRVIDISDWSKPIPVDPGAVVVELTTPEGTARHDLQLAAQENTSLELSIVQADDTPQRPVGPPPDEPEPEDDGGTNLMPFAIVGYAIGGLGMVGFGIFGSLTLSEFSELEEKCPTNNCRPEDTEDADDGRAYQTAANISLIVGIVGLAAGTGLLITSLTQDDEEAPEAAGINSISVGPGSVMVSGSF